MGVIGTIAVIGAGIMGREIALASALGGYRTVLEDLLPDTVRKASAAIKSSLDEAVRLARISSDAANAALARIEYADSVECAARKADLVIETVPEEIESKIEIFTLLDKVCRPSTILASNTSSLSITELSEVTYRANKCVGMHFLNPLQNLKLLEIIPAFGTDEETLAAAVEVGSKMGKEVIVMKECPGRSRPYATH